MRLQLLASDLHPSTAGNVLASSKHSKQSCWSTPNTALALCCDTSETLQLKHDTTTSTMQAQVALTTWQAYKVPPSGCTTHSLTCTRTLRALESNRFKQVRKQNETSCKHVSKGCATCVGHSPKPHPCCPSAGQCEEKPEESSTLVLNSTLQSSADKCKDSDRSHGLGLHPALQPRHTLRPCLPATQHQQPSTAAHTAACVGCFQQAQQMGNAPSQHVDVMLRGV